MATDAEIRGHLLTVFYQLRHNAGGWVPTSEINLAGMEQIDQRVIGTVGQHLADAGLIEWKPLRGAEVGFVVGTARITGLGVDVIEGEASPSINLTLPNQKRPPTGVEAKSIAGEIARRPTPMGVAAKGEAGIFVPETQSWDVAAQIAAQQRGLGAAVQPLHGATIPPTVPAEPELPAASPRIFSPASGSPSKQVSIGQQSRSFRRCILVSLQAERSSSKTSLQLTLAASNFANSARRSAS